MVMIIMIKCHGAHAMHGVLANYTYIQAMQ